MTVRCPICNGSLRWAADQPGPMLCLRCGSRVERVEAVEEPAEPGATVADDADPVATLAATPSAAPPSVVTSSTPRVLFMWSGWVVALCVAAAWAVSVAVRRDAPLAVKPMPRVLPAVTPAPPPLPETLPSAWHEPAATATRPVEVESPALPEPPAPATVVAAIPEPPDLPSTTPASRPARMPRRAKVVRLAPVPMPPLKKGVTDEEIGRAIQRGVDWMIGASADKARDAARKPVIPNRRASVDANSVGARVLGVYALLQCGKAIDDPRLDVRKTFMASLVGEMRDVPNLQPATYARALRASALALHNRPEDRKALAADVAYLVRAHTDGRYGYGRVDPHAERETPKLRTKPKGPKRPRMGAGAADAPPPPGMPALDLNSPEWWDNSNSQYGLLGVWAGAEAGVEVPNDYWDAVEKHWRKTQDDATGMWAYFDGDGERGTATMTAAGTASLFVAEEYRELARPRDEVGRRPFSGPLARAMRWWEAGDNAVTVEPEEYWGYALYGIERVGLASGFKHLGTHDWYRELAQKVIERQSENGSWGDDLVHTSYALLFLARGRHPILMNKLRYDGSWSNRPRDTANLARYAGKRLEREFNWQVVSLTVDWTEWLDSPVLYIAGHEPIPFTDADLAKLRAYVEAGGMLFTHADGGSESFNAWARDLATKLFPAYELADLPPSHAVYSVLFDVKLKPELKGLRNGARLLMVHSPRDVARAWQQRDDARHREAFETGVNLAVYAAGKRDYRNRLDVAHLEPPPGKPFMTVPVARLRYAGNWDPEPGAWRQYAGWFKQHTGMALDVRETPLKSLSLTPGGPRIAHLTGTGPQDFTDDERAAIKAYVEAGGVLVIDPCGGSAVFRDVARNLVTSIFADADVPAPMSRLHPLLNLGTPGMADLRLPQLRLSSADRKNAANTYEGLHAGDGCVLLAPLDVTCGLLGVSAWEVRGYTPGYARALMTNTIFWTLDNRPDPGSPATTRAAD